MQFVFVWMVRQVLYAAFKGRHCGAPLCQLLRDLPVQVWAPPVGSPMATQTEGPVVFTDKSHRSQCMLKNRSDDM